jgi:hypothetical protein
MRHNKRRATLGQEWMFSRFDLALKKVRKHHPHAGTMRDPRWAIAMKDGEYILDSQGNYTMVRAVP